MSLSIFTSMDASQTSMVFTTSKEVKVRTSMGIVEASMYVRTWQLPLYVKEKASANFHQLSTSFGGSFQQLPYTYPYKLPPTSRSSPNLLAWK